MISGDERKSSTVYCCPLFSVARAIFFFLLTMRILTIHFSLTELNALFIFLDWFLFTGWKFRELMRQTERLFPLREFETPFTDLSLKSHWVDQMICAMVHWWRKKAIKGNGNFVQLVFPEYFRLICTLFAFQLVKPKMLS